MGGRVGGWVGGTHLDDGPSHLFLVPLDVEIGGVVEEHVGDGGEEEDSPEGEEEDCLVGGWVG